MRMGIQIGAKPDAGFEDPIGMLKDCHRRIEHFLEMVCVVAEQARGRALNEEESAAVKAALHYFRVGGQRHNADEEESLFPRLRATDAAEDVGGLEDDHREADGLHRRVDELYSAWMAKGTLDASRESELAAATSRLKEIYSQHIELEESVVFPRAARVLGADEVKAMGREFRARRE